MERRLLDIFNTKTQTVKKIYKKVKRAITVKFPMWKKIANFINRNIHAIGFISLFFLVIGTAALANGINPLYLISGQQSVKQKAQPVLNMHIFDPTVTPINPSTDTSNETYRAPVQSVQPTADPDPVIACTATTSSNCSGQSINVPQSECSSTTCCGFLDGSWKLMTPNNCSQAQSQDQQNHNASVNTGSGNYPTYTPLPTWTPLHTYAPYVAPTTDPAIAEDQRQHQIQQCKNSAMSTYQANHQNCVAQYGGCLNGVCNNGGSQACEQLAQQEEQREAAACN